MDSILIAGGAGFIGSHLCKKLLSQGYSVICIDNLITGSKSNIVPLLENPHFIFIEQDIRQPLRLGARVSRIDAIFHLASPASPNKKSPRSYINFPIETLMTNSLGTYNLLQLVTDKTVKFLYASTSEVYGNPSVSPQPESYWGNVNPNGIRSVYDEGKRFGEALTFGYYRKFGINARIVRIFNTFGPFMQKDDGRVVTTFIQQALTNTNITIFGKGDQTRSFCYVDDMVEGLMKAMFTPKTEGQVINLGNPDERKISEIATMIKTMAGSLSEIVYEPMPEDDPSMRKPDIAKAKQLLQWEPTVSLEEGLKKTLSYFMSA